MLRLRTGKSVMVRFVEPRDADAPAGLLPVGFPVGSRYNTASSAAMSELPQTQLDHFIHVGEARPLQP